MDGQDLILLWALTVMILAAVPLRLLLAKKQGKTVTGARKLQMLIFPALLVISLVLYQTGTADIVLPAVLIGVVEELICSALRKRKEKQESGQSMG